jgi:hypothetical protein
MEEGRRNPKIKNKNKKFIFLVNLAWFSEISLYNQVLKNFSLIVVALA